MFQVTFRSTACNAWFNGIKPSLSVFEVPKCSLLDPPKSRLFPAGVPAINPFSMSFSPTIQTLARPPLLLFLVSPLKSQTKTCNNSQCFSLISALFALKFSVNQWLIWIFHSQLNNSPNSCRGGPKLHRLSCLDHLDSIQRHKFTVTTGDIASALKSCHVLLPENDFLNTTQDRSRFNFKELEHGHNKIHKNVTATMLMNLLMDANFSMSQMSPILSCKCMSTHLANQNWAFNCLVTQNIPTPCLPIAQSARPSTPSKNFPPSRIMNCCVNSSFTWPSFSKRNNTTGQQMIWKSNICSVLTSKLMPSLSSHTKTKTATTESKTRTSPTRIFVRGSKVPVCWLASHPLSWSVHTTWKSAHSSWTSFVPLVLHICPGSKNLSQASSTLTLQQVPSVAQCLHQTQLCCWIQHQHHVRTHWQHFSLIDCQKYVSGSCLLWSILSSSLAFWI